MLCIWLVLPINLIQWRVISEKNPELKNCVDQNYPWTYMCEHSLFSADWCKKAQPIMYEWYSS